MQWESWHLHPAFIQVSSPFFSRSYHHTTLREDASVMPLNHTCFPQTQCVFDAFDCRYLCKWPLCQIDCNCAQKRTSLAYALSLSSMLLIYGCIIALLPCMIANSYDFQVTWERVQVRRRGGGESKQMAKHCLWPHLLGDLCTQHAHVCQSAPFKHGSQTLFLSPPLSP